jgi:hypothetical protein
MICLHGCLKGIQKILCSAAVKTGLMIIAAWNKGAPALSVNVELQKQDIATANTE